ncbi:MAG: Gx transporter family protein [Clostridia bacterium]|nr:Gx transporter family protein [Clostridia bacterium]
MALQIKKTKKLTLCAVLTATAFALSFIEGFIPVSAFIPLPGIKLGLSNIVIMFSLCYLDGKSAFTILLLKNILVSFLFSNPVSFIFSMCGGVLSLLVMKLMFLKYNKFFSLYGISICGALFHNIGQLIAAGFVMKTATVLSYSTVLLLSAVFMGFFTAFISSILFPLTEKINLR